MHERRCDAARSSRQRTWSLPSRGTVGMACLIVAESAIFTIFVVAYLFYVGKSLTGPTPREVLETPIFFTICLLSSSLTIHLAGKCARTRQGARISQLVVAHHRSRRPVHVWHGREWHRLIYEHGLTISTNLFGTTYYSLVGLHAFHVTVGLIMLVDRAALRSGRPCRPRSGQPRRACLSLYWHFVDASVGRRVHRGVRHRAMRRSDEQRCISAEEIQAAPRPPAEIEMPAPTAWPLVLAFGFTLMFAGLLTSVAVSILGAVLAVAGCVGWFREVFPHEHEEPVPSFRKIVRIATQRAVVERLPVAADQCARLASGPDLSGVGGCEGRTGRKRRDGAAGLHLWSAQGRKHLVSRSICLPRRSTRSR